jgi:hypothetical protein
VSLVGKNLGPYRVVALVGQGAMAVVYRSRALDALYAAYYRMHPAAAPAGR